MLRFAGIDVAMESHDAVVVDETGREVVANFKVEESDEGHRVLIDRLGSPNDVLIVMEATGHYWINLHEHLTTAGFKVAVINALRSRHFAQGDLLRAKTDQVDALSLARFGAQKKPTPTELPEKSIQALRESVRFLERLKQTKGDSERRLWRLNDLCFTEIRKIFDDVSTDTVLTILQAFPTASAMRSAPINVVAKLMVRSRKTKVGRELAEVLKSAARTSVATQMGPVFERQVRCACEDIVTAKRRISEMEKEIKQALDDNDLAKNLMTIDGVGQQTAAKLLGELGDPSKFKSPGALASYVGVAPATSQSGRSSFKGSFRCALGNSELRHALWMPVIAACRNRDGWLGRYYVKLRERGKPGKVATIACMRKLLIAVHWVATHNRPFVDRGTPVGAQQA